MRWAPLHPRQMLAILAATLLTMLLLMLLAAPDLATLDFSLGSDAASSGSPTPLPDRVEPTDAPAPTWVTDPLAPPLDGLSQPAAAD